MLSLCVFRFSLFATLHYGKKGVRKRVFHVLLTPPLSIKGVQVLDLGFRDAVVAKHIINTTSNSTCT